MELDDVVSRKRRRAAPMGEPGNESALPIDGSSWIHGDRLGNVRKMLEWLEASAKRYGMQVAAMVASGNVIQIIASPPTDKGRRPMVYAMDPKVNQVAETMESSEKEPVQGDNQTTADKGEGGKDDGGKNGQKEGKNRDKAGGNVGGDQKGGSINWS